MELLAGVGVVLAVLALVAPMTPGFQNPWVVAGLWLALCVYGFVLVRVNWAVIANVIVAHQVWTIGLVAAYAGLAAAGMVHTYVIPAATRASEGQKNSKTEQAERRALILSWRKMLAAVYQQATINVGTGVRIIHILEQHDDYHVLRPHLSHDTVKALNGQRMFASDNLELGIRGKHPVLEQVRKDIDRIESEWGI